MSRSRGRAGGFVRRFSCRGRGNVIGGSARGAARRIALPGTGRFSLAIQLPDVAAFHWRFCAGRCEAHRPTGGPAFRRFHWRFNCRDVAAFHWRFCAGRCEAHRPTGGPAVSSAIQLPDVPAFYWRCGAGRYRASGDRVMIVEC